MPSRVNSQLASDYWGWPVDVPTHTFVACGLTFNTRASGTKYHPLASESTISVSFVASFLADPLANSLLYFREILLRGIGGTFCDNFP